MEALMESQYHLVLLIRGKMIRISHIHELFFLTLSMFISSKDRCYCSLLPGKEMVLGKKSESWSLSHIQLFANPWTVACQALLSTEFFTQESWSGLPISSSVDLPNPGVEPGSPALQADSLSSESPGKPRYKHPEQKIFFRDSHTFQKFLTKRGPLEKVMANHFSILPLRTSWTVWKGKKK